MHISLLSLKLCEVGHTPYPSSSDGCAAHTSFIAKLLSHNVLKEMVYANFPNGLSPLDLAQQFELHNIAALIQDVGGRPGVWADIPQEIEVNLPMALAKFKDAYAPMMAIAEYGEPGIEFLKVVLSNILQQPLSDNYTLISSEQLKDNVLRQKPSIAMLARLTLSVVTQNWRLIGYQLLEDIADCEDAIKKISQEFSDDRNRFMETLNYWLKHGSSVTWKALLNVLGYFETKHTIGVLTETIVSELVSGQICIA